MEEKNLTEQESLRIITEMIAKTKHSFHESGVDSILWGSVVAVCGLVSFAQLQYNFYIGFDIWILTLVALIPQLFITIRERRQKRVVTHMEAALNAIWMVYGISLFALIFYFNTVPGVTSRTMAEEGLQLVKKLPGGGTETRPYFIASSGSLLLLLYAIPTMATGVARKFRPMLIGGTLCYIFFLISCFVPLAYDMLLNGLAGIFNWLIPGLILRSRLSRAQKGAHV